MNAIVIGGTSGFGEGIAKTFTEIGIKTAIAGRTSELFPVDVRNAKSVEALFAAFRDKGVTFDIVVLAAGKAIGKDPVSAKEANDFVDVFETNTMGLLYVAKEAYNQHLSCSKGVFVYLGSIASELSYPGGADYCAAKAANSSIMKTLRKEWLGSGVRLCEIELGLGDTNFQRNRYNGNEELAAKHTAGVRLITPEDVGRTAWFVVTAPEHLNFDRIMLKPLDQASHGLTVNNAKNQF